MLPKDQAMPLLPIRTASQYDPSIAIDKRCTDKATYQEAL